MLRTTRLLATTKAIALASFANSTAQGEFLHDLVFALAKAVTLSEIH
jgi:hypothetical protein